jgi:hypothetical protein
MWCGVTGVIGLVGAYCIGFVLAPLFFELFGEIFANFLVRLGSSSLLEIVSLSGGVVGVQSCVGKF